MYLIVREAQSIVSPSTDRATVFLIPTPDSETDNLATREIIDGITFGVYKTIPLKSEQYVTANFTLSGRTKKV